MRHNFIILALYKDSARSFLHQCLEIKAGQVLGKQDAEMGWKHEKGESVLLAKREYEGLDKALRQPYSPDQNYYHNIGLFKRYFSPCDKAH